MDQTPGRTASEYPRDTFNAIPSAIVTRPSTDGHPTRADTLQANRLDAISTSGAESWMKRYGIPTQPLRAVKPKARGIEKPETAQNPDLAALGDEKLAIPGAADANEGTVNVVAGTPISASTVNMAMLKEHYRWEGCADAKALNKAIPEQEKRAFGANDVMKRLQKDAQDFEMAIVVTPDSWAEPKQPRTEVLQNGRSPHVEETNYFIATALKFMREQWKAAVKTIAWPYYTAVAAAADRTLKPLRHLSIANLWSKARLEQHSPYNPAWFWLQLRYAAPVVPVSLLLKVPKRINETTVERGFGSVIQHIFDFPHAYRLSNSSLKCPTVLGCFASYPKPDIVCQMIDGVGVNVSYFKPVVLVAEAKTSSKVSKDAQAQMAMAVQPTLQMFAIHLSNEWRDRPSKSEKPEAANKQMWRNRNNPCDPNNEDRPQIPDWMRVYGILYDAFGVQIYCYFPYYKVHHTSKGSYIEWHFMCVPLNAFNEDLKLEDCFMHNDLEARHSLAIALCIVKDAANELEQKFIRKDRSVHSDIVLPDPFETLNKVWGKLD